MKHAVMIPSLGLVEQVTVTGWVKAAGDRVARGETIATIETEKSTVDIEAPADGVLAIAIPAGPELISADAALGYVEDGT
jgi:pyruvate/2-oxoglutarate dehydrogenase complex dihydrolipoamide acyltransferase (E2) component